MAWWTPKQVEEARAEMERNGFRGVFFEHQGTTFRPVMHAYPPTELPMMEREKFHRVLVRLDDKFTKENDHAERPVVPGVSGW